MADLSGYYFDVIQGALNAGDSFDIDFGVQNTDLNDAGPFYVDFYLSNDISIDSSDYFLSRFDFSSGLFGNLSELNTISLMLPDKTDPFWFGNGTYTIGMMVDAADEVVEFDETNNSNAGFLVDNDDVDISINTAPTAIGLSKTNIDENQPAGAIVGNLSTTDPDVGDTHTYTLVAGTGDTDNGAFTIEGNVLKANESLDFETKNSYSIRVQTDDGNGGIYEEEFTIAVNDIEEGVLPTNQAPTDISLSSTSIAENQPVGAIVGNLSTTDPDADDTHTYTLITGTGDTDNGAFTIEGNVLKTKQAFDFEVKDVYSIRVETVDSTGNTYEEVLTINVNDVLDGTPATAPSAINFEPLDLRLRGDGEDNTLKGDTGNDRIRGRAGNDRLVGKGGNDQLFGQRGDDVLIGGKGSDLLNGGAGKDRLLGRAGDDVLVGSKGIDDLTGGNGKDLFVFNSLMEGGDRITDFSGTNDLIDLRTLFAAPQYNAASPSEQLTQFVKLVQMGTNTEVKIDTDGNGVGTALTTLVTLDNVAANAISAANFVTV